MKALTQQQKNILDKVLWAAGAIVGFFTSSASSLPPSEQALVTAGGVLAGDVISDLVGMIDTGKLPTAATISAQLKGAWPQVKPAVQAELAKLSPTQQPFANVAVAVVDAVDSGQTPEQIAATVVKALGGP